MILARRTDSLFGGNNPPCQGNSRGNGLHGRKPPGNAFQPAHNHGVVCPFLLNNYYSAVVQAVQIAAPSRIS